MSIRNISVIIPCYKAAATLRRAAASALADAPAGLELLLVDDGSPDRCPAMCDAWAATRLPLRIRASVRCTAQTAARVRRATPGWMPRAAIGCFFSMPMMSCCRDFGPRLRHFPPRRT